jgi:hypothetical protein
MSEREKERERDRKKNVVKYAYNRRLKAIIDA